MGIQRFIIFIGILGIILLLIDVYFLSKWQSFSKKHYWAKWTYKLPWAYGLIMFIFFLFTYLMRLQNANPPVYEKVMLTLSAIWYLPKLIIVPIMILIDLSKLLIKLIKSGSSRKPKDGSDVNPERRKLIAVTGWAMTGIPFGIVINGIAKTNDHRIYEAEIPLKNLPDSANGFKIIQLSDIHAGSYINRSPVDEAVGIVNSLNPDIVVITGDFVNFHPDEFVNIGDALSKLKANYGIYGCLGNHDHYMFDSDHEVLKQKLNEMGIKLLINENTNISINGMKSLQLLGVDNVNFKHDYSDFPKAMEGVSVELPSILLCHDPTNWDRFVKGKLPIDLMLSGHTHGGQIGIDFLGEYLSPARIIYKQWAGLYETNNQYLYINRGLGVVGPPVRVSMPPEITIIRLAKVNA